MEGNSISILLVTANVGSIFEEPTQMLKIWAEEFLATVARLDPRFIALHCQEVGGKNYENSMKHVNDFVELIMSSNELRLFDKVRVYLDEDYSSAEHFTALGNLYFIHESVEDVLIWNFKDLQFQPAEGAEINSGNIETVVTKEKAKFPQDFFPECKWSRKGFLRTRWSLNGTVFDLINIHLFHDASNFISMATCPSVYSQNREKALRHTLQRFHSDIYGSVPYFLFGDFNFRTDNQAVVKKLTEGLIPVQIQNNKKTEYTKVQYNNDDSETVLTVGKKEFNHLDHQNIFLENDEYWLKEFDKEPNAFTTTLCEFPVHFPPSYPYEENVDGGGTYMKTRCPAWCDRVLLSHTAKELLVEACADGDNEGDGSDGKRVEYGLIGIERCMGDHKPVYFRAALRPHAGTLQCCDPHALYACSAVSATRPPSVACQCCRTFASVVSIRVIDMSDYLTDIKRSYPDIKTIDARLLHEPITRDMLTHEPYTPESADSHSPVFSSHKLLVSNLNDSTSDVIRRGSVSPEQLKNKLTSLVMESLRNSNVNISLLTAKTISDTSSSDFDMCDESKTPEINRTRTDSTASTSVHSSSNLQRNKDSSSNVELACISTRTNLASPVQYSFRGRSKSELSPIKAVKLTDEIKTRINHRHVTNAAILLSDKTGNSSQSLARLQSHHSSSDEDWFEFDLPQKKKKKEAIFALTVDSNDTADSKDNTNSNDLTRAVTSTELVEDMRKRKGIIKNDNRRNRAEVLMENHHVATEDGLLTRPLMVNSRYICISNIDNPVKVFRETAV